MSVPFGATATFNIAATTTSGTLTYQWFKNGAPIAGAYSTAYTTPPVSATDTGAVYTAAAAVLSVVATSNPATLTVGARSPKAGDLRFQQVASPAASAILNAAGTAELLSTAPGGQASASYTATVGTPLNIGTAALTCDPSAPANCIWGYFTYSLPSSLQYFSASYLTGPSASFASTILALPATSVVSSLDVPPGMSSFAVEVSANSSNGGFDPILEVVSPGAVQATVSADGLKSRVVTAVTFDSSGMANLISYGWQGDTTTAYDTTTAIVAPANVAATAANMGAQGYIITAFGGNDANSYVLVGTKVHGDTLPRPTYVVTDSSSNLPSAYTGYSPMSVVTLGYGSGTITQSPSNFTFVYQQ